MIASQTLSRPFLVLLLSAAAFAGDGADFRPADVAAVEVAAPRADWYVGEPVPIRVRVTADEAFLRERGVQPFQRALDLPVRVEAGLAALDGFEPRPGPEPAAGPARRTLALDGAVAVGERVATPSEPPGARLSVTETVRWFVPRRAGEFRLAAPVLRFAHVPAGRAESFLGTVSDTQTAEVAGSPLVLRVHALPDAGRPAGFTGAVGRFVVGADADRREIGPGESVRVTLTVASAVPGDGDLSVFDSPPLPVLAGFHVLGAIDDRGRALRRIVYEIAPLPGTDVLPTAIPPIPFPCFDTRPPARWQVLETAPLPLVIRRAAAMAGDGPTEPRSSSGWLVGVALAVAAAAIGFAIARRRTTGPGTAAESPAEASLRRLALPGADPGTVLSEHLAGLLGCPAAAVISPDLAERLVAAGVPPAVAGRAASLVESLVAARYGGAAPADAAGGVAEVLRALSGTPGCEKTRR